MDVTYVSVAKFGSYDESETCIIYAGNDYEQARQACIRFSFPNPYQNYATVETWSSGKRTKIEEIIS